MNCTNRSRFALIGCAYGNVPALRACVEDAQKRGVESFLFLGDAIGCCGHTGEVLEVIQREFDAWIAGNLEQQAAQNASGCGCGFDAERDEKISGRAFQYALEGLTEQHREWLSGWPDVIRLETEAGRFVLCHGSPRRTNEFLYRSELSDRPWRAWCAEYDAQGMFCAHTGFPWTHTSEDGFVLANTGAAGKPDHDGDPAVHYATLDVTSSPPDASVQRVTYDHRSWEKQLEQDGVDEIYRTPIREGRWTYGLSRVPEDELSHR